MSPTISPHILAAVASPRRLPSDAARDAGRRPAELFGFFGIAPGDRVAELMCGSGYCVGLLSEIVGPSGRVYAYNTPASLERRKGVNPLDERMSRCALGNVESLVAGIDALMLPAGLDAVLMVMTYHDTVNSNVDRGVMNRAILAALKPGGMFGVVDHHAASGRGLEDCGELHRIEKQRVVAEVVAAGFTLAGESALLENTDDPCAATPFTKGWRDRTSRFVLKFVK